MSSDQRIMTALNHSSFASLLKEQLDELSDALDQADDQLMVFEVDRDFQSQQLAALDQQLVQYGEEQKRLNALVEQAQAQKDLLERQRALLLDYLGLLKGDLFQRSVEGAGFFTQSQLDFASAHQMGELTVGDLVKQSEDGYTIAVGKESYCFVRGRNGQVYFHPDPDFFERVLPSVQQMMQTLQKSDLS